MSVPKLDDDTLLIARAHGQCLAEVFGKVRRHLIQPSEGLGERHTKVAVTELPVECRQLRGLRTYMLPEASDTGANGLRG